MNTVLADMGVPMLMVLYPAAFLLLVPVVLIETWISTRVKGLDRTRRFQGVLFANLISTIVGWPIAWFLTILPQLVIPGADESHDISTPLHKITTVIVEAGWLSPYRDDLYWMVPAATIVLMVPAFFASVVCEWLALKFQWPDVAPRERNKFVWRGNLASYTFLVGVIACWLLASIAKYHNHPADF